MQLLCLLSQEWSLFLWINKLLLPLCSCLFVSMVYFACVIWKCCRWFWGGWLFLTALLATPCRLGSFPVPGTVISCSRCVWLLWQDSKWVEEKQYLFRTNQELHEKVHCMSFCSLLLHHFIGNIDTVSRYWIMLDLMLTRTWFCFSMPLLIK